MSVLAGHMVKNKFAKTFETSQAFKIIMESLQDEEMFISLPIYIYIY